MSGEFRKAFKGIDSAIKQGTARALNRALSSSRARMAKALRDETGLTNKVISTRMREVKANQNSLGVKLAIATKVGVLLSAFKPLVKKVQSLHKGNKKPTTHYGVSVKIGRAARSLVPGGWLATAKSGKELVLARKGAAKYPTVALRTPIFSDVAEANKADVKQYMANEFDRIAADYIEYEIGKRFDQNK